MRSWRLLFFSLLLSLLSWTANGFSSTSKSSRFCWKSAPLPPVLHRSIQISRNIHRTSSTALNYGESRGVDAQLLFDTWEWTANLGAPAALVAGAVLATMVEAREYMSPTKSDSFQLRIIKKLCRFLLLTAFGLEIVSIFVTTVTGTALLSHGDAVTLKKLDFSSPMGFLMNNWEFEYLTARIAFLQGLFHWLGSVSLELLIPKPTEGAAARRVNTFAASALATILVGMLSFLNRHVTFYQNYWTMLIRYMRLSFQQFVWPVRPLTAIMLPMTIWTFVLGWKAFLTPLGWEDEENNQASMDSL